jgi:hypothetical protein
MHQKAKAIPRFGFRHWTFPPAGVLVSIWMVRSPLEALA